MNQTPWYQHDVPFEEEHRTAYLIAAYIQQKLTTAERDELDAWVGASKENLLLFEELTDEQNLKNSLKRYQQLDRERARRRLQQKIGLTRSPWRRFAPYAVAASLMLLAGYLVWERKKDHSRPIAQIGKPQPAAAGAPVLTLSGGRQIVLPAQPNGALASDGAATVLKSDSGLVYRQGGEGDLAYHTLDIPRGSQYALVLADGTRVWLNAASSLKFPAAFRGASREVELLGEAYFEVAPNKQSPFRVQVLGGTIEVLGTHFNIRGYADEPAVTTLLEGRVRVQNEGGSALLQPGQEAQITPSDPIRVRLAPNPEAAASWKNGLFVFHDAPITEVMKAIERWYNVKVLYEGNITHHFNGTFDRKLPLSRLLHYLEGTDRVHFQNRGNTVTVLP